MTRHTPTPGIHAVSLKPGWLFLMLCAAAIATQRQVPSKSDRHAVPATPSVLQGYQWQLQRAVDVHGHRIGTLLVRPHKPLTLVFDNGLVSVRNACNAMGGRYRLVHGRLQTGGLLHTMMACADPALTTLDRAIVRRLREEPTLSVEPGPPPHLHVVTSDGDTLLFVGRPSDTTATPPHR